MLHLVTKKTVFRQIKQNVENGRHIGYEIVIPEWLYNSVVNEKLVLTLDQGYFGIKGGLERWLYLFARKTSGWQVGGWTESIDSIYVKSGSKSSRSEFRRQIAKLQQKQFLGYKISFIKSYGKEALHFLRDNELIELSSEGRKTKGANVWRKAVKNIPS